MSGYHNGMTSRKIAIVTGANRGIGHEIARQLLKEDLVVVVGARDKVKCERAVASLKNGGANVDAHPLDVSDTRSVKRFIAYVEQTDLSNTNPADDTGLLHFVAWALVG